MKNLFVLTVCHKPTETFQYSRDQRSNLLADYPIKAPLGKIYLSEEPSLVGVEAAEVAVVMSRM